ncbi:MAG TPA: adenosylhomocysteinase, partial [Candidatus Paceibacterota bacterium]
EAAKCGDLFITVTGNRDVLTSANVRLMKNGAILANSGHFDCEIDVKGIRSRSLRSRVLRPFLEEFVLRGGWKVIYVLAEGRLVNLSAAEGHPSEVMSMSFCGQVLACEYLVKNHKKLGKKVYALPSTVDDTIAALQLETMGIQIDSLSAKQKKYLSSWQTGT